MDETEILKKKVDALEKRLALYEHDSTIRGYYVLNQIVNQHIDMLKSFDLSKEISVDPKDNKKYDRVKGLWEGLKTMITDLNLLKAELKITGNEEKDKKKVSFMETLAEKRY